MRYIGTFVMLLISAVLLSACNEKQPSALWPPAPNPVASPVISGITPADSAGPGVLDISIQGENFGSSLSQLFVYFGTSQVKVTSVTPTQIVLPRPGIYGDSLTVKVVVQNADLEAKYPNYAVSQIVRSVGDFVQLTTLSSLTGDDSGNVFVAVSNTSSIAEISPQGQTTQYATYPKGLKVISMRVGASHSLYIQCASTKNLYEVPPGGGSATKLFSFLDVMNAFDFDQYGNIYAGGNGKSLNIVKTDNSVSRGPDYSGYNVLDVRVYNGYLYVLANNVSSDSTMPSGVFRHQILSTTGSLGPQEVVLEWANTGNYAGSTFNGFSFASDGTMYITTDNTDPILMVSPDRSSVRSLYQGILPSPGTGITWSGSNICYILGGTDMGVTSVATGKTGVQVSAR